MNKYKSMFFAIPFIIFSIVLIGSVPDETYAIVLILFTLCVSCAGIYFAVQENKKK